MFFFFFSIIFSGGGGGVVSDSSGDEVALRLDVRGDEGICFNDKRDGWVDGEVDGETIIPEERDEDKDEDNKEDVSEIVDPKEDDFGEDSAKGDVNVFIKEEEEEERDRGGTNADGVLNPGADNECVDKGDGGDKTTEDDGDDNDDDDDDDKSSEAENARFNVGISAPVSKLAALSRIGVFRNIKEDNEADDDDKDDAEKPWNSLDRSSRRLYVLERDKGEDKDNIEDDTDGNDDCKKVLKFFSSNNVCKIV